MGGNTLHKIGEHRADARADVIFIHGLDGDARKTWMSDPKDETSFWPGWLAAERSDVNVWSLDYPASSSGWRGHGMAVRDAATSILDRLALDKIGQRPIIFVVHSMGGLIAKQLLKASCEAKPPEKRAIAQKCTGIAFLATPHLGATMASFLNNLGHVLGSWVTRLKDTVKDLDADNPYLEELNDWYRNQAQNQGIATIVYREDVAIKGVMIVSKDSANPRLANVDVVPIDADHMSICKPGKGSQVDDGVRAFIDKSLAPAEREESLPPPSIAPMPYTLPPAGRFVGREAELAAMIAAALDDDPRPIIVLGQAGIGKSALTLQMLHDKSVAARFGTRRYFIRLDTATEARAIWTAIVAAWGETPGPNPAAQVIAGLRGTPVLLTLDNGETPWQADSEGCEAAFAELAAVEGLKLVVSIRGQKAPFGLDWRRPVEALEPLPPDQAKALFRSIASSISSDDPALPDLLRALDGLPLAITLLAYQAQGETQLKSILADYRARRLTLKVGKGKNLDLATSIQLSLDSDKLDEAARKIFLLAGRLPAGIADADAAELVDGGVAAARALRQIGVAFGARDRTLMLAPIREYAASCDINPEDQARALAHYLGLLTTEGPKIGNEGGRESLTRLAPEMGNFEAIITLLAQPAGKDEATDKQLAQLVVNAADGLCALMRFSGLGSPANYEATISAARTLGDTLGEANCIKSLGDIALARSDHDAARKAFDEARPLYQRVGASLGEANCIYRLGEIALARSDHDAARKAFDEARVLYQRVGASLGEANCIRRLGDIALARSDHDAARKAFDEARVLYQSVGDTLGEANCIYSLGEIALARSDHDAARKAVDEARPLYQRVGASLGEANCIQRLGDIALARSDHDAARKAFDEARPLYQRVGDTRGDANCIYRIGEIALARSDHDAARKAFDEARPLYQRVGDTRGDVNCIARLGDIALARSDHDAARKAFDEARPLYQRVGDTLGEANCIKSLGEIALALLDHDAARKAFDDARPLYQRVGDTLGEANCIYSLGEIALARSDHHVARKAFDEARPLYQRVGNTRGEANCALRLGDMAEREDDKGAAQRLWRAGLDMYRRIAEPYSIGISLRRLARISSGSERASFVAQARAAWASIDRADLIAELDKEFGAG